jgi:hypothetical protein
MVTVFNPGIHGSKEAFYPLFNQAKGSLNQDSTDVNEYLFGQFLTAYYFHKTIKRREKIGQAVLVLICIWTVPDRAGR